MQTKQVLDKLSRYKTKNKIATITHLLIAAFVFYKGEQDDLPYSRFFTIFFLYLIFYFYNKHNSSAENIINDVKAQILFREFAAKNNVSKMKEYLSIVAYLRAGDTDRDTMENALHFAVRGNALDAIEFLIEVQTKLDAKFATDPSARLRFVKPDIINQQNIDGNTPVHLAILKLLNNEKNSDITLLKLLQTDPGGEFGYNSAINPKIKNNSGETIGSLVDKLGKVGHEKFAKLYKIVEQIIRECIPSDDTEFRKAAAENRAVSLAKYVRQYGVAKLAATGETSRKNILHFAVERRALDAVNFILGVIPHAKNMELILVNSQDKEGNTPLHTAVGSLVNEHNPIMYTIFINLISNNNGGVSNEKEPLEFNTTIDLSIKNKMGKTVLEILEDAINSGKEHCKPILKIVNSLEQASEAAKEKTLKK